MWGYGVMAKKLSINKSQFSLGIIVVVAIFSLGIWARAYGEKVGNSPESGSTSYISSLTTALLSASYGSDSASPDWGVSWNRIKTAAQWVPNGTITAANVISGKTFYNSSRTLQTGTLLAPGNCPTQQYSDNIDSAATQTTNCTDTIVWTTPTDSITGTEKQDPISGLIWSNLLVNSAGTVTFSATGSANWSWGSSAADNVAVGYKTAITLCSSMGNGWRLPTQKELTQAYIDGTYFNLSQPWWNFWASTELDVGNSYAWIVGLANGQVFYYAKTTTNQVRCVR